MAGDGTSSPPAKPGGRPLGNSLSGAVAPEAMPDGHRIHDLLGASPRLADVVLVATDGERFPASRLLLSAASAAFAEQLGLEDLSPGADAPCRGIGQQPSLSAASVRAVVALSCGAARPFDGCSLADARSAASALRMALPDSWWRPGAAVPKTPRPDADLSVAGDGAARAELRAATPRAASGPPTPEKAAVTFCQSDDRSQPHELRRSAGGRGLLFWVSAASWCLPTAALLAYAPARGFNLERDGFFMDDQMIQKNAVVTSPKLDVRQLMRTDYWGREMFDPEVWTHKSFRPVVVLSFRLNYHLHGFNSAGFHITNVLLHGLVCTQLGYLALRVLRLPSVWSAMLVALFAAHPVHSESLLYIVGRADILCAVILLFTVQLYAYCINGQPSLCRCALLPLTMALVVLAGLCKETGFTFFGFFIGLELLALTRAKVRGCFVRSLRIVILLVVGVLVCFLRHWYTQGTKIERMDFYSNPIASEKDPVFRRWSYLLVHGLYMKLLVWPFFLCYDYSMGAVPLVHSAEDVRLLLPCAGYLALALFLCIALQRLRGATATQRFLAEGPLLGVAFFVLSFLPMMNLLFPVGTLVAERLLYLPSIGFLVAAVSILHSGTQGHRGRSIAAWWGLAALLAVWGHLCYRRVLDWRTVENLTIVDGLKQLGSSRTQVNLAGIYLLEGRFDEATVAYRRSIAADPQQRDSQPLYHVGQIHLFAGRYEEAERYLHKAVTGYFSPLVMHEEEVWHDYALSLWHVNRAHEAVHNFQNSLITNPAFPKGYNNLACALVLAGVQMVPPDADAIQQGLQAIERAVSLAPDVPLYWRNAASLLEIAGDTMAAQAAWQRYAELDEPAAQVAAASAAGGLPRDCIWEFYFR